MNWTMRVSMTILMSCFTAGCSRSSMPGKYVSQSAIEVDMLDLVEAPAGHLSGTLVISAINQDGSRQPDVVRSVSGSIYRGNVSLQIGNSGILTNQINAVGTLSSEEMRLDISGKTENFKQTTMRMYGTVLAALNKNGNNIKQRNAAIQDAKDFSNYMDALNAELQGFVGWGNDRIGHVSNVHNWYANRIIQYQKCIDFVEPLALRHVPSWKWQSCVLNMDNDSYNRQQTADALAQVQNKELAEEQDLNAKIANLPQRISEVFNTFSKTCSLTASEADCKVKLDSLKKETPPSFLSLHINEYRNILPQLHSAIDEDMQARAAGEKELSDLVSEADRLLRSAH